MNFVHGVLEGGAFTSDSGAVRIEGVPPTTRGPVTLGVRPEDLYTDQRVPAGKRVSDAFPGRLEVEEPMGNEVFAYLEVEPPGAPSSRVVARLEPQPLGDMVSLVVDLDKVHLFDRETGVALV